MSKCTKYSCVVDVTVEGGVLQMLDGRDMITDVDDFRGHTHFYPDHVYPKSARGSGQDTVPVVVAECCAQFWNCEVVK